ncbi:MAG: sulfite exporter TauE/SafE family protein [bacterium]|nr:sulfite exporter TauE/SafE family protein [bacterium]
MLWFDIFMAFSVGMLGSIHCIGMCGGIVAALSMGGDKAYWLGIASYHTGRILSYSALGLAAGLIGSLITARTELLQIQLILSVFAGIFMIIFALQIGGVIPERFAAVSFIRIPASLLQKTARGKVPLLWGLTGLANGLLPCGMVYAALALALKQADPLKGTLMMTAFGMGTVPAMTVLALTIRRLDPFLKARFLKLAVATLVLFGLFTIGRGYMQGGGHSHNMPGHNHTMDHTPDHTTDGMQR